MPSGHGRWSIKRDVIISIHPEFTEMIFSGNKKAELRKNQPSLLRLPFTAYVYESKPGAGAIVGEITIDTIGITKDLDRISKEANISVKRAERYLQGENGYLWMINNYIKYDKPVEIEALDITRPPQSWQYVKR